MYTSLIISRVSFASLPSPVFFDVMREIKCARSTKLRSVQKYLLDVCVCICVEISMLIAMSIINIVKSFSFCSVKCRQSSKLSLEIGREGGTKNSDIIILFFCPSHDTTMNE
jgi:hypothetical protein